MTATVTFHRPPVSILLVVSLWLYRVNGSFWSIGTKEDAAQVETKPVAQSDETPVEYGVDVSFPIHYSRVSDNFAWLPHNVDPAESVPRRYRDKVVQPLGDKQKFYDDLIQGCVDKFGKICYGSERDRVAMSLRQPSSMQNYTDMGYKKIRAPESVFKHIKKFWDENQNHEHVEKWGRGNTYTNNWDTPTYMLSVEDRSLRGGGNSLKKLIWDAARETIQEWTGQELTECSLYGIRVYKEGAVLATHVDRLPLVSSAIINVAQDVDEPWPLEVYGHDGKATNITMEPGDMILYESHSVLHGRPFPLKGRYMANIFIHFEPNGHSLRHNAKLHDADKHVDTKYKEATERGAGGHEVDANDGLPSYIVRGSAEEANWRRFHHAGQRSKPKPFTTGSIDPNLLAQQGDLEKLQKVVEKDKAVVGYKDENGWTPMHEAARGGHEHVVKFLSANGADVNERSNHGIGGTPLYMATLTHGEDHPVSRFLQKIGALNIGPEL